MNEMEWDLHIEMQRQAWDAAREEENEEGEVE